MKPASPRCYFVADLVEILRMSRSSFYRALAAGELPFLEELRPRIGNKPRYRADLVDKYLTGSWKPAPIAAAPNRRRFFRKVG